MESVKLGGITQGVRRRVLDDGTVVEARFDGTTPTVTVLSGPSTATKPSGRIRAATWIPRGFVLYPVSDESVKGWGVPVVNDLGTMDPYAATNLAPGVDTTRWTQGGPLGQVLLTQVPELGTRTASRTHWQRRCITTTATGCAPSANSLRRVRRGGRTA